jgi:hypothetical protein
MTSATDRGAMGTGYGEPRGLGLVFFAAAIANSHLFVANAHYVIGDLRAWGWVALILGLLQLLAGGGVMIGNQAARWFGIVIIGLNLISQLFFIPAYPFWALTIIAFDVFALYGLCVYGSRANVTGE